MKKLSLFLFMIFLILGCGSQKEKKVNLEDENARLKIEIQELHKQLDDINILVSEKKDQIENLEEIREASKIDLSEKNRKIETYKAESEFLKGKNIELTEKLKNKNGEGLYWVIFIIVNNVLWFGYSKKNK